MKSKTTLTYLPSKRSNTTVFAIEIFLQYINRHSARQNYDHVRNTSSYKNLEGLEGQVLYELYQESHKKGFFTRAR